MFCGLLNSAETQALLSELSVHLGLLFHQGSFSPESVLSLTSSTLLLTN